MSYFHWYLLILFLAFAIYNVNEFIYMVRIHLSKSIGQKEKETTIMRHLRFSAISALLFLIVSLLSFIIHARINGQ